MILYPPCKINLGLNIVAKRSDGFHNIETCFYPIHFLTDILEIVPGQTFSFSQSAMIIDGLVENNLVVKAYRLMQNSYKLPPVKIHLHKLIPTGAGLGGGSSDAACTLLLLNNLFQLQCSTEELKTMAANLGSDCPFFIEQKVAFATGRGEVLSCFNVEKLKGKYIVLVKPNVHISTAEAYANCLPKPTTCSPKDCLSNYPVEKWKTLLINDFEKTIFDFHPILGRIKEKLYNSGAIYASMSGSGSTLYGIYEKNPPQLDFEEDFFVLQGQL